MLTVAGEVVRMAWFVERQVWLWWWKGGWSEAVVESDVGGGGGCCEAVVERDVGGGGGWSKITIVKNNG